MALERAKRPPKPKSYEGQKPLALHTACHHKTVATGPLQSHTAASGNVSPAWVRNLLGCPALASAINSCTLLLWVTMADSWQLNLPAPDPSRGRMQGRLAPGQTQLVQVSGFLPAQQHLSLPSGRPE